MKNYNDIEIKVYIEEVFKQISEKTKTFESKKLFYECVEDFRSDKIDLGIFFLKCKELGLMDRILFDGDVMVVIKNYSYLLLEEKGISIPECFSVNHNM